MERIPILDLKAQYRVIREEAIAAFDRISESCAFAQGPDAKAFEEEFAAWCGAKHGVGCNSGTSALHLALHCLDVGPGDEVITVPMTFIATAWAIYYVGAKPVFVDIDPVRRTLDPALLERAITPRTKAIIPVHLYGMPADMDPILEIANRHGIPVIEDAAQAHGASYKGKRVGTLARAACFSFYPGKNLGAFGEGGALVTDDEVMASRARNLRSHAQSERYYHDELGYNYRMDSIQAAMLSLKLKHLDEWNAARARHAKRYNELLAGLPITLPREMPETQSVWHCYVIESEHRDYLRAELAKANIESGLHYPLPLHLQKACISLGHQKGDFPVSERLGAQCLSLPMYAEMREDQLQRVSDTLRSALNDV
jgi:dTDP-4-amino-4,6-dideoxygalactose transaminase